MVLSLWLINSCSSSNYLATITYREIAVLKVETLKLVEKSIDRKSEYESEIEKIRTKLDIEYQIQNGIDSRSVPTKILSFLIIDFDIFVREWEVEFQLPRELMESFKYQLEDKLDLLIKVLSEEMSGRVGRQWNDSLMIRYNMLERDFK